MAELNTLLRVEDVGLVVVSFNKINVYHHYKCTTVSELFGDIISWWTSNLPSGPGPPEKSHRYWFWLKALVSSSSFTHL